MLCLKLNEDVDMGVVYIRFVKGWFCVWYWFLQTPFFLQLFFLEEKRRGCLEDLATLIQKIYRGWKCRTHFLLLKKSQVVVAAWYRRFAVSTIHNTCHRKHSLFLGSSGRIFLKVKIAVFFIVATKEVPEHQVFCLSGSVIHQRMEGRFQVHCMSFPLANKGLSSLCNPLFIGPEASAWTETQEAVRRGRHNYFCLLAWNSGTEQIRLEKGYGELSVRFSMLELLRCFCSVFSP